MTETETRPKPDAVVLAERLLASIPAEGLSSAKFNELLRRQHGIMEFDEASVDRTKWEYSTAGIVQRRGDRWYGLGVPEELWLSKSEQLMKFEDDRLRAQSERERRNEEARREEEAQIAKQRDDFEYANVSRHIARFLRERGIDLDARPVAPPEIASIGVVRIASMSGTVN